MSYFYFEMVSGSEPGRRWDVPDGALSIGRNEDNNIIMGPGEKLVSGNHCIIYKNPGRILLQDLGSTNGTFVNEEKVGEATLTDGAIIGFGKTGPRLKLVEASSPLPTPLKTPSVKPSSAHFVGESAPTIEDPLKPKTGGTRREQSGKKSADVFGPSPFGDMDMLENPSQTMQVEKKLLNHQMGSSDMHKLLKDGKRVEKLIDRGNLSLTHEVMLKASYKANKKNQKSWFIVLGIVVFISASISTFFFIRSLQYEQKLKKGLSIEQTLDQLEKSMDDAQQNPEANHDRLKQLFSQYEKMQGQLSSVKMQIKETDKAKFYADPIEAKIDQILSRFGQGEYHIPPQMIERVKYHISIYTNGLKPTIGRYLKRRELYAPMMTRVLTEKKLPVELSYISMLESGYISTAVSPVGAGGLWQFMPATGQKYGLRVDAMVDERTDPEKATYAAAEYFKDLISIFGGKGSVMLAMAAYNAGEGRVMGALKKIDDPLRDRDFWYLYHMGYLPDETKEYIPRFISLVIISENAAQYGFTPSALNSAAQSSEPAPEERNFIKLEDLEKMQ